MRLFVDGSSHPEDSSISAYIAAATDATENYTQLSLAQRTVTLKAERFSKEMELPVYPVLSVESITYLDREGDEQALTDFRFIGDQIPAMLEIDSPPSVKEGGRNITVTLTAGYPSNDSPPSADLVPDGIKQAIMLMTGHFFENRESVVIGTITSEVPQSFEYLLHPYRVIGV